MSKNLDLNSLKLFKILFETKSLSTAASICDMSVPAASRQINKMREIFEDELFVRFSHGMTPSSRAQELYEPICGMINQYSDLFDKRAFAPESCSRIFKLGGVDNAFHSFIAPAIGEILESAPHLSLDLRPLALDFYSQLRTGELDFAIYPVTKALEGFYSEKLCDDVFVFASSINHPLAHKAFVTYDDLAKYRQVTISVSTNVSSVNVGLVKKQEDTPAPGDRTAVWTSFFASTMEIIKSSELIGLIPFRLADRYKENGISILGRPKEAPIYQPLIIWHERVNADPAFRWLRGMLLEINQKIKLPSDIPLIK